MAGFTPSEHSPTENDDDDDGMFDRLSASGGAGGVSIQRFVDRSVFIDLWSYDEEIQCKTGFHCVYNLIKRVFYARPIECPSVRDPIDEECSTKGAITALLDVAEGCGARRITLGLGAQHASRAEFVCALLYLSFQVSPSRKSPFANIALILDLDIGTPYDNQLSGTGTGTSDCSTSAEDELNFVDSLESD